MGILHLLRMDGVMGDLDEIGVDARTWLRFAPESDPITAIAVTSKCP
jgi:hypothetical protein